MKVVMTFWVRNEEDILEDVLRYHLSRGVDQFIITDNLSDDGTPEILADWQRRRDCVVLQDSTDTYSQWRAVTRMARIAAEDLDADWVIHGDADEFWWTREATFSEALARVPAEVGILEVGRFDFLPRPECEGSLFERMIFRDTRALNALGRPLPPKVVHRAHPDAAVEQGNHGVIAPGLEFGPTPSPFTILHFPLRTLDQFTHGVVVGGRAYENNTELHPSIGDVRRQLYELYKTEGLDGYWDSQILDQAELDRGLADGSIARDVRLRDYLRQLALGPVEP